MKKLILCFGVLFGATQAMSQTVEYAERLSAQLSCFPQEKLYVHTDKGAYMGGDTLWFRAYVVDAWSHRPVSASKYVYVEFRSNEKPASGEQPAEPLRIRVLEKDGVYSGYIPFPMTAKSGEYTLLAYTQFMRNAGPDYFFRKNIRVGAYGRSYEADKPTRKETAFDVAFFPEGGYLIAGQLCCVGFKALQTNGTSVSVSGVVRDDKGQDVVSFLSLHAGMGKFFFTPQAGRTYTAVCTDETTRTGHSYRLPAPQQGCIVQVSPASDRFTVNVLAAEGLDTSKLSLLVHCRGALCYQGAWKGSPLTFLRKDFPDGVLQLLLVDKSNDVLSERLVFCYDAKRQPTVSILPDKPSYGRREKVMLTTEVRDTAGNPLTGCFSVAVTDNRIVDAYSPSDIRTALLLESDLRGYIEDPAYYFDAENPTQLAEADALMLTQGWRRYDIPKVLRGEYAEPDEPLEIGQEITGRIRKTGLFRKRNFMGYQVGMLAPSRGMMASAMVDSVGKFALNGFDLPDSTFCVLRASGPDNKEDVELLIDEVRYPDFGRSVPLPDRAVLLNRYNQNLGLFTDSLRNILLEEVVISSAARKVPSTPYEVLASKSLNYKQLEEEKYGNIEEALMRQHGVSIRDGWPYVFGLPAVFVVDGVVQDDYLMQVDSNADKSSPQDGFQTTSKKNMSGEESAGIPAWTKSNNDNWAAGQIDMTRFLRFDYNGIPIDMVSRIDVIAPVNTVLFGSRVGNKGAIVITTKTGGEQMNSGNKDLDRLHMAVTHSLGYQTPAEFYSPVYDTPKRWNAHERDLRTTLYWNPALHITDGKAVVEFYTGDEGADYSVSVEGVNAVGVVCHGRTAMSQD